MGGSRLRLTLLAAIAGFSNTVASRAPAVIGHQPQALELAVKATFLPKFLSYVEWPHAAIPPLAEPFQLCVIGRDPFGARLDQAIAGQRVDQHPIIVRRMETTTDAKSCRLAFVGGSPGQSAEQALKTLQGTPVLTVTDARLGNARGMVHFALKDGRVRFHIDDTDAAASKLAISSRLLDLALSVRSREGQR